MTNSRDFQIDGIVPIIPTPFTTEEKVDWPALGRLVDFACASGSCAMCLPAYASEFYKLSEEERLRAVAEAVGQASGRMPVFAQVNFVSARQAVESAQIAQKNGASAISVAVPRIFAFGEWDLQRYFDRILSSIDIPLLIQDFNPSGPTITPRFVAELHRAHPHFRWVKLEEPMMSAKVAAILDATGGEVGVLEGWGGMYMLDLIPAGICGVMPGLAVSDLLATVFRLAKKGEIKQADKIFQGVLPQIVFSLQHMELFHHAEKRLLEARGILAGSKVRELAMTLDCHLEERILFLNGRILAMLDELERPYNPALVPAAIRPR
ncbi:MAG TPA: dihydrodipicolinate synthase family protein [Bryobacteraceae bacterium]|nr:dihydrodipicolinate synthase family protein [Bryobacteraceae bacterium]